MFKDFMDRRKREEQVKGEGRLPPGQSLTQKFPVLHYGPIPQYNNLNNWTFRVYGLVDEEKTWNWTQFSQLPRRKITMDIHCVTKWSKFDTEWEGVHLQDLIDGGFIKLRPDAKFCIQHAEYGYTTNTPTNVVLAPNFLMATQFDGKPLDPDHGYPLRGVVGAVPGQHQDSDRYLWKGSKWLRALEFTAEDHPGFWEQAGYSNSAGIWDEERYARRGGW